MNVLCVRLATRRPVFPRDAEPAQSIAQLFRLRHKLVHPKPGYAPSQHAESELLEQYSPSNGAHFVVTVATAAGILVRRAFGRDKFDMPADLIWMSKEVIP